MSTTELSIVQKILSELKDVVFFGSRVKGTCKPFSDLDICIKDKLSPLEIELIREQFENSDLPFKVDIVEYDKVTKFFQKIIDTQGIDISHPFSPSAIAK